MHNMTDFVGDLLRLGASVRDELYIKSMQIKTEMAGTGMNASVSMFELLQR